MRNCTQRWPQSGQLFSKLGHFFPIFRKGQGIHRSDIGLLLLPLLFIYCRNKRLLKTVNKKKLSVSQNERFTLPCLGVLDIGGIVGWNLIQGCIGEICLNPWKRGKSFLGQTLIKVVPHKVKQIMTSVQKWNSTPLSLTCN